MIDHQNHLLHSSRTTESDPETLPKSLFKRGIFLLAIRSFNTLSSMEDQAQAGNTNNVPKEDVKEAANKPLSKEISLGDLLWVKIHGSSWWPSQVVDEKEVSDLNKPSKKSSGDILVRLYGSYIYLYACKKCRLEFEKVLEEYNGNYDAIFAKSLEEDLSCLKSGKPNRQGSKSKAANGQGKSPRNNKGTKQRGPRNDSGTPKRVSSRKPTEVKNSNSLPQKPEKANAKKRKNGEEKEIEPNTPEPATTPTGTSQELSKQKVKVMKNLGLTAPAGSPFCQNEFNSPSSVPCE